MEQEISLLDLFNVLKKYFFTIIVSTLVGAIIAGVLMYAFVDPKYSSQAQLLVSQQSGQEQQLQYNEVQTNITLVNTYRDIIQSESVLQAVSDDLGGMYSPEQLREMISVDQQPNSQAFNITATAGYPENAQKIVESLTNEFDTTLREVYGEDISSIYVLSPATFNPNKVSPSLILYALIGAILGLAVSVVYALIREVSDTTVRDVEFVQSLGLVNLGSVFQITKKEIEASRIANQRSSRVNRRGV